VKWTQNNSAQFGLHQQCVCLDWRGGLVLGMEIATHYLSSVYNLLLGEWEVGWDKFKFDGYCQGTCIGIQCAPKRCVQ
jgi:hypothetical protein